MNDIKYPKIKNAVKLCLLIIIIQVIAGIVLRIILGIMGLSTTSYLYGVSEILVQLTSFILVIRLGWKNSHKKFNELFKFNAIDPEIWVYMIILAIGFIILSSEIDNLVNYIFPMSELWKSTFTSLFINQNIIFAFISIGIIPAIAEEMTFRGIFISGFKENYSSKKSIIISAILFGLIHLNPWQFIGGLIFGLLSGWLIYKTNSILLGLFLHLLNNSIYLCTVRYPEINKIKGFNSNFQLPVVFQPLWFDIIGLLLFVVGLIFIIRKTNNLPQVD